MLNAFNLNLAQYNCLIIILSIITGQACACVSYQIFDELQYCFNDNNDNNDNRFLTGMAAANNNDDEKKVELDPNKAIHQKARSSPYVNSSIERLKISDDKVRWNCDYKDYKPPFYTDPGVVNHKLPDASLEKIKSNDSIKFKFNELDNKIDRRSHIGKYDLDKNNYNLPLNPIGRTGLTGRGLLWRWGPNHAADPIVTRWKRKDNDPKNDIICDNKTNKSILEFVAIERKDGGGWAIPGGMVDPGEQISRTLKREFGEETMDTYGIKDENEKKKVQAQLDNFFKTGGVEIYKGYCDDPRNTDNAWMETVAFNFHDKDGDIVGKFNLKAGDDAAKVKWMEINKDLKLYASHNAFIQSVVKLHDAHW